MKHALHGALVGGLWFVMTSTTLWALGLDPVTAVRYAWVPLVTVTSAVAALGAVSALQTKMEET